MDEKRLKFVQAVKWSIRYMILYCCLVLLAILYEPKKFMIGIGIIGGAYVIINAVFINYKRERLFVNGLISAIVVMQLGILLGNSIELEGVISLGVAISIMDILSFTKYGKRTANAKAMSNPEFMYKLIVYGKGKGELLVPTCGIGDYFYYALWIAGIHNVSEEIVAYIAAASMIFLGTLIDHVIIGKIYQKETYKGFPATVIPFICVLIVYGAIYYI